MKIYKFAEVKNSHPDLIKVIEPNTIKIISECAATLRNSHVKLSAFPLFLRKNPKSSLTKKEQKSKPVYIHIYLFFLQIYSLNLDLPQTFQKHNLYMIKCNISAFIFSHQ